MRDDVKTFSGYMKARLGGETHLPPFKNMMVPPIKQTLAYRFLLFKLVRFIDFDVEKIKPSYVKVSTKIN